MTAWIKLPGLKMWPSGVSLALKSPQDRVAVCHCHADEAASGILGNSAHIHQGKERAHLRAQ